MDNSQREILATFGTSDGSADFGSFDPAILIDHIGESTPDAGVTIDGLQIKDGGLEGAVSLDAVTATGSLTMDGSAIDGALGVAVASAATTDIWVTDGNTVHITGTEAITSLGTAAQAGATRSLVFDDAATLTNGANLILPGGADIVTAAGDTADVVAESTTQHRITNYTKADGTAIKGPAENTQNFISASVKFNGNTGAIIKAFNVSSVTRSGTGLYQVNFASPLGDADYCLAGAAQRPSVNNDVNVAFRKADDSLPPTVNDCNIAVQAGGTNIDCPIVTVMFTSP